MLESIYAFDSAADMVTLAPPDGFIFVANGLSARPGYYVKLVSSGTATNAIASQQEVLL